MAIHRFTRTDSKGRQYPAKTVIPDKMPNKKGKARYRTPKAEYTARHLSGQHHGKSGGTMKKMETALKHMDKYFNRREGLDSFRQITQGHWSRFVDHLKTKPSLIERCKPGREARILAPKTVKDILGQAYKVLVVLGKADLMTSTYDVMGLAVGHKDLERPIQFTPDWEDRRNAYQQLLEQCRTTWYAEASSIGRAFGLREAERCASRDVLYKDGDKMYATYKLGGFKEVTERQLQGRYGYSFTDRLEQMQEGMKYLIVEEAKGNRNRIQAINTPSRFAAVERLHNYIKSQSGHSKEMKVYSDRVSQERAEKNYLKIQGRYGADRASQLNSHADRHREAQRMWHDLLDAGYSKKEAAQKVVVELGHSHCDKIRYYIRTRDY